MKAQPAMLAARMGYHPLLKRGLDLVASSLGLGLLSPVLLAVATTIWLAEGRPIFFRQQRVGQKGKPFRIWKFRTMRNLPGARLTIGDDPRVTRLGKWLRKSKIDELPQLFNVLVGEMTLVGPRPELPEFVARYTADELRVLLLRPGITSLASIRFRNEDDLLGSVEDPQRYFQEVIVPERARLDWEYAARATLWTDLRVLTDTVTQLLCGPPKG